LRKAGWSIWFLPDARVHHKVGASSDKDWQLRARMVSSLNWSRYYYFSKRESTFRGMMLKALVVMGAFLRLVVWSIIALIKPARRDQVKLFRQVLRQSLKMRLA
jgi:GT2 family glycosyltransferase